MTGDAEKIVLDLEEETLVDVDVVPLLVCAKRRASNS
jgi:hypothetical protein